MQDDEREIMQTYEYDGEIIDDIEKWATERNEKMVEYVERKRDPFRGVWEYQSGKMPETFWNCRLYSSDGYLPYSHKYREPYKRGGR